MEAGYTNLASIAYENNNYSAIKAYDYLIKKVIQHFSKNQKF